MRTDYKVTSDDALLFDRVRHRAYASGCVQVSIKPCRESFIHLVRFSGYDVNVSINYRCWWVSWTFEGEKCCHVYDRIHMEFLFRMTDRKTKYLRLLENPRYRSDMLFPEFRGCGNG